MVIDSPPRLFNLLWDARPSHSIYLLSNPVLGRLWRSLIIRLGSALLVDLMEKSYLEVDSALMFMIRARCPNLLFAFHLVFKVDPFVVYRT